MSSASRPLWQELKDALAVEEGPAAEVFARFRDLARKNLCFQPWVTTLALLGPPAVSALLWRFQPQSNSLWVLLLVTLGYLPGVAAVVSARDLRLPRERQAGDTTGPGLLFLGALHFMGFLVVAPFLAAARAADLSNFGLGLVLAAHVGLLYISVYPRPARSDRNAIDSAVEKALGPLAGPEESRWGPLRPLMRLVQIGSDLATLVRLGPRRVSFGYGAVAAVLSEFAASHRDGGLLLVLSSVAGLLFAVAYCRDDRDLDLGIQVRLGLARTHFRLGHLAKARFLANDVLDTPMDLFAPRAEAAALLLLIENHRKPFAGFAARFQQLLDYAGKWGTDAERLGVQRAREMAGTAPG